MANIAKMESILSLVQELEEVVEDMVDAEGYSVAFFDQTFQLTHQILNELHALETLQIEALRKQMEAHKALLRTIPQHRPVAVAEPEAEKEIVQTVEKIVPAEPVAPQQPVVPEEVKPVQVVEQPVVKKVQPVVLEVPPVVKKPEPQVQTIFTTSKEAQPIVQPTAAPTVENKAERSALFLSDLIEKKNLSDFRKAFSLNDRFRFRRELFAGNEARMNQVIADLNEIHTYEASMNYLKEQLQWDLENEAVTDFMKLLEKRFL